MPTPWFTEVGEEGTLSLRYCEDGWIATTPETEKTIRCILQANLDLSPEDSPHRVSGTVSKYVIGSNNSQDYLHFLPDDGGVRSTNQVKSESDNSEENADEPDTGLSTSLNIRDQASYPYRELAEIDGTGDYISVVARVDHIYWVKKNESGMPDLKGRLTDKSISYGVAFVIDEDVSHPYLDEDMWFLFDNVYDYYWEPEDQTTIWISDKTEFTELQPVSSSTSSSSTSSSSSTRSSSELQDMGDLHAIATDTIGDMEFTISQEDRDSAVSKAKQKARNQQRDPAIDPRFQINNEDEE